MSRFSITLGDLINKTGTVVEIDKPNQSHHSFKNNHPFKNNLSRFSVGTKVKVWTKDVKHPNHRHNGQTGKVVMGRDGMFTGKIVRLSSGTEINTLSPTLFLTPTEYDIYFVMES